MEAIIAKALSEGLGYALFCILFFYVLKKQELRDAKSDLREITYQNIISDLTKNLQLITVIGTKIDKIEEILRK